MSYRKATVIAIAALAMAILPRNAFAADKPKVFITGENSFQVEAPDGERQVSGVGGPTVAEGVKLFQDKCASCIINMRRDRADYIVSLTDDGSGPARKGRRAIVFSPSGDLLFAESVRSLSSAVKDACNAIGKDWNLKQASK
jgi:hypothetical protein